jgi:hypothetical protein
VQKKRYEREGESVTGREREDVRQGGRYELEARAQYHDADVADALKAIVHTTVGHLRSIGYYGYF